MLVNLVQCHGGSALDRAARSRSESPVLGGARTDSIGFARKSVSRVYVLDVHPLCYRGSKPDSSEFLWWMRAFLRRIVLDDPVIAVFDGEFGNDYRRKILPSYKAGRRKFKPLDPSFKWTRGLEASFSRFQCFLRQCNIPVVKVDNVEADDVIATLARQVNDRSLKAVIASPDKDFKQLVSENVELLIPFADLRRWSFYTVKDYVEQHKCEPGIELGLRCLLGDAADGVPGVPGFGRKTALKLMRKHGSLENLLSAAAFRTVGKPYIQDALKEHSVLLEKNLEVLSLRRDINVELPVEWCLSRDKSNDLAALQWLEKELEMLQRV
ncbi:uncharacterized protein LOC9640153 [Selaginella moellendorffii]|nr:uncharacterized protein LOC9640153 [Selaginella moellendorffii]|eukprot:XP_002985912.2 uncharacterized protein LOC9640153 [Selaginella moellendorffii]